MSFVSSILKVEWYKAIGILLLLIALIGGVLDENRRSSSQYIANVGKFKISFSEFEREASQDLARFQEIFGKNFVIQEREGSKIRSSTLRRMTEEKLILNMVRDLGLSVSPSLISEMIAIKGDFVDSNGNFDYELFKKTIKESGLTEDEYLKKAAQKLVWLSILELLYSGTITANSYLEFLVNADAKTKMVDLIHIYAPKGSNYEPDEKLISNYYSNNEDKFYSNEMRKVRYVVMRDDVISSAELSLDDKDIESAVEARLEEEGEVERVDLINFMFSSEKEANDFFEAMNKNYLIAEGFASKVAKSINKMSGINVSSLSELFGVQFEVASGIEFSKVFTSEYGWHVVKVDRRYKYTADDVRPSVVTAMRARKHARAFDKFIDAIGQDVSNGMSIDDVAARHDLIIKDSGFFDANGNTSDDIKNKSDLQILSYPNVLKRAFSMLVGGISDCIYIPSARAYVLFVVSDIRSRRKLTLDEVKDEIVADLKSQNMDREANKSALEIMEAMAGGASFSQAMSKKKGANAKQGSRLAMNRFELKQTRKLGQFGHEDSFKIFNEIDGLKDGQRMAGPIKLEGNRGWILAIVEQNSAAVKIDESSAKPYAIKYFATPIFNDVYKQTVGWLYGRYKVRYNKMSSTIN